MDLYILPFHTYINNSASPTTFSYQYYSTAEKKLGNRTSVSRIAVFLVGISSDEIEIYENNLRFSQLFLSKFVVVLFTQLEDFHRQLIKICYVDVFMQSPQS